MKISHVRVFPLFVGIGLICFARGTASANPSANPVCLQTFSLSQQTQLTTYGNQVSMSGDMGCVDQSNHDEGVSHYLSLMSPAFGGEGGETFVPYGEKVYDQHGMIHTRARQHLYGLPIYGAELIVHVDAVSGRVVGVNGAAIADPGLPSVAQIDAALAIGQVTVAMQKVSVLTEPELVYYADQQGSAQLAWKVEIAHQSVRGPERDILFMDAAKGHLIARHPQIHHIKDREVYSFDGNLPGTLLLREGGNTNDPIGQVAYNYVGLVYDYFQQKHNRDSFNGAGATIVTTVDLVGNGLTNNAFWNGQQIAFGRGDGQIFGNFASGFDIVAHEFTHAVTVATANLIYANEPGALNEAMSDILAAAADVFRRNGVIDADTWKEGEDVFTPNIPGDAIRYMNDPARDGISRDYYPQRYIGPDDNGGVHWNSGIANLAFVLLVEGGKHPRGKTLMEVPGISIEKAEKIFYRALTAYMTENTTFEGARANTGQAARDLYSEFEYNAVHAAWDAVGVPGSPARVAITSPRDGTVVAPGFVIKATAVAGERGPITSVSLVLDDKEVKSQSAQDLVSQSNAPLQFASPEDLSNGAHTIQVRAVHSTGEVSNQKITVIVDPSTSALNATNEGICAASQTASPLVALPILLALLIVIRRPRSSSISG